VILSLIILFLKCFSVRDNFFFKKRVLLAGQTRFKGSWLSLWLLSLGADVWGYALPPEGRRSLFRDLWQGQAAEIPIGIFCITTLVICAILQRCVKWWPKPSPRLCCT